MRAASVDDVVVLFEAWGDDRGDEDLPLSQLDHALQTAALAEAEGASPALVAAALLHDVGHLLALAAGRRPGGDDDHDHAGARYLAALFPPAVTAPIALHVDAKRYRRTVEGDYGAVLSEGSVRSLELQGGAMSAGEAAAFAAKPAAGEAVRLRGWDDRAKVEGLAVPGLAHYRPLLDALTRR